MTYIAIGEFMGQNVKEVDGKKDPTKKYRTGQLMIEIDNSWQNRAGETVPKKCVVPFKVFGKTAEEAEMLKFGETVKVTFELEGREYQGKYFVDCKAVFVNRISGLEAQPTPQRNDDIPFGEPGKAIQGADGLMPWERK